MSWLYTIVFAGLMFSGQGAAASDSIPGIEAPPAAVAVDPGKGDETERFEQSYPLSAGGRVNVSNVNGSITVEAWDKNEVKLQYTKVADSKERLADVDVKIESRADYFGVETDYGDWKSRNGGDHWRKGGKLTVEFHLMVPRGAVLNEIETVNGSVSVSNFVNMTKVSAVNGSVSATNIRGTAKLSTVNGEVTADFDRLESGSKISLETVNGRVNLVIPSDSNATVKADSLNGNITNDFGLPVRKGKYVGRDLYGKLGTGEIQIRLESVNGGLSINRKNDGKTASPSVNLLPQKEKDDEDWDKDDDDDSMINSAKIDKEVAKAAKVAATSTKVTAKAVARAQVEINKIQPELARITAESIARSADAIRVSAEVLNSQDLQQKIIEADMKQQEALARISDASFFPSIPRVERKSASFPVKGTPKVALDAKGCSVTIRGWDKSEVQYRIVQFSDPRSRAPLNITENHNDTSVTITVENPDGAARGGDFTNDRNRVRIEVFVPRKSNLKIKSNGEIRLDGVSGDVELTGSDEAINVRDVDGSLKVANSDGRIRVIGFRGEINASTSDGAISLEGDFKKLTALASNGSIILTLPEGTSADLEASCDEIEGDGIGLTRISGNESITKYRIGSGGSPFKITTDGEISVRGLSSLKEGF